MNQRRRVRSPYDTLLDGDLRSPSPLRGEPPPGEIRRWRADRPARRAVSKWGERV